MGEGGVLPAIDAWSAASTSAMATAAAAASWKLDSPIGCCCCCGGGPSAGAGMIMAECTSALSAVPRSVTPLPRVPGSSRALVKEWEVRRPAPSMRAPLDSTDGCASLDGLPSPVCKPPYHAFAKPDGSKCQATGCSSHITSAQFPKLKSGSHR